MITRNLANEVLIALKEHFAIAHGIAEFESKSSLPSRCRADAMYVFRSLGMTTGEIGMLFRRDHSTVVVACQTVNERRQKIEGYREELDVLLTIARKVCINARQRGMMRERLNDVREGITHHFMIIAQKSKQENDDPNTPSEIYEVDGYLTTGTYGDGRLGEIFLKMGRHGGEQAVFDAWATAASVALQHGASVDVLFSKWVGISFEPSGATKNAEVPRCSSVLDYCARVLIRKYGRRML